MEPINEEQITTKVKKRKGKAPIVLTSLISSTVAALVTSSVFMFATDYTNTSQTQLSESSTQQATETTSSNTNSNTNLTKTSASNTNATSLADMVETASKAIVGVVNYQEATTQDFFGRPGMAQNSPDSEAVESGTGSGVIWKKESGKAYIITNNHVIEGATKVEISLYDGKKTTAEVVGADALTDLAVLTIDASYVSQTLPL